VRDRPKWAVPPWNGEIATPLTHQGLMSLVSAQSFPSVIIAGVPFLWALGGGA
jgi:hypothetical protein